MSFFDLNKNLTEQIEALPENIKSKIKANADSIKTSDELNELVRRISSAETGKIF